MSAGAKYWSRRFRNWPNAREADAGYTLLLPVPGDLPVFLEIALAICGLQQADSRRSTLVLPDKPTKEVQAIVERAQRDWRGPLEVLPLPAPERWLLPRLQNPFLNYGLQFITGLAHCRTTHAILHDADLFLLEDNALENHFEACAREQYACLGVDQVWDGWFAERGYRLAATWELCVELDWAKSFPPYQHMGRDDILKGEAHTFDISLYPQACTASERIGVSEKPGSIVHFNHVIATYRKFCRQRDQYLDANFRLLLIRLFVDLFAKQAADYRLPDLAYMTLALGRDDRAIRFPDSVPGQESYSALRAGVERILEGAWTAANKRDQAAAALSAFDAYYEWTSAG